MQPTLDIAHDSSRFTGNKDMPHIDVFLGTDNRDIIHNLIIRDVYERTNGKIRLGKQSDTELQLVMITVLQKQYNIYKPVQELNRLVVQTCTSSILENIGYYMNYVKTAFTQDTNPFEELLLPKNTRDSKERINRSIY